MAFSKEVINALNVGGVQHAVDIATCRLVRLLIRLKKPTRLKSAGFLTNTAIP